MVGNRKNESCSVGVVVCDLADDLRKSLTEYIHNTGLEWQLVRSGDARALVSIVQTDDRRQCDEHILWAGGWITCPVAHVLATRLRVEPHQLGQLLNLLDIKVRHCELGLFE